MPFRTIAIVGLLAFPTLVSAESRPTDLTQRTDPQKRGGARVQVVDRVLHFVGTNSHDRVIFNTTPNGLIIVTYGVGKATGPIIGEASIHLVNPNSVDYFLVETFGGNDHVFNTLPIPLVAYGGDGHDRLVGASASDVLFGEKGNDALFGGTGEDGLYGGPGSDILVGGRAGEFPNYDNGDFNWTAYDDKPGTSFLTFLMEGWDVDGDSDTLEGGGDPDLYVREIWYFPQGGILVTYDHEKYIGFIENYDWFAN